MRGLYGMYSVLAICNCGMFKSCFRTLLIDRPAWFIVHLHSGTIILYAINSQLIVKQHMQFCTPCICTRTHMQALFFSLKSTRVYMFVSYPGPPLSAWQSHAQSFMAALCSAVPLAHNMHLVSITYIYELQSLHKLVICVYYMWHELNLNHWLFLKGLSKT